MSKERFAQWAILVALLLVPLGVLLYIEQGAKLFAMPESLETEIKESMPGRDWLRSVALDIRLLAGEREQNGIFISEDGLMSRTDKPSDSRILDNVSAISAFDEQLSARTDAQANTYLAVLPTSAGVLQQNLPQFAQSGLVDQQRKIEEIYNQISISVRTVDVYSTLKSHSDEYIYYRTDSSLTSLGGYYVYSAVARRMGLDVQSLGEYTVDYIDNAFYGNLYQAQTGSWGAPTAPYRKVQPDILSLYRYSGNREYLVSQRTVSGNERVYHTLYPMDKMMLDSKLDVYLGGNAAMTDIESSTFNEQKLLVFGDRSANLFLPFMTEHYQHITLVNLFYADDEILDTLRPEEYDAVLFAYAFERFCSSAQSAMVRRLSWPTTEA